MEERIGREVCRIVAGYRLDSALGCGRIVPTLVHLAGKRPVTKDQVCLIRRWPPRTWLDPEKGI